MHSFFAYALNTSANLNDGITITLVNKTYFLPKTNQLSDTYYVFDKGGFFIRATNVASQISSIDTQLVNSGNIFKIDTKKRYTVSYPEAFDFISVYDNFKADQYQMNK